MLDIPTTDQPRVGLEPIRYALAGVLGLVALITPFGFASQVPVDAGDPAEQAAPVQHRSTELRTLFPYTLPHFKPLDMAYLDAHTLLAVDGRHVWAVRADEPGHAVWPISATASWSPARIETEPALQRVYVLDDATERIHVFDGRAQSLHMLDLPSELGSEGVSQVDDFAVAANGEVFVMELRTDDAGRTAGLLVHRFDSDGAHIGQWAPQLPARVQDRHDYRGHVGRIESTGAGNVLVFVSRMSEGCHDWRTTGVVYSPAGDFVDPWSADVPEELAAATNGTRCPDTFYSDLARMERSPSGDLYVLEHDSVLTYDAELQLRSWTPLTDSDWRGDHDNAMSFFPWERQDRWEAFAVRPNGGFAVIKIPHRDEVDASNISPWDTRWSIRTSDSLDSIAVVHFDENGGSRAISPVSDRWFGTSNPEESTRTDRVSATGDGGLLTLASRFGIVTRWAPDGGRDRSWYMPGVAWDIAAVASGGWVSLGADADAISVSRYGPDGQLLWRSAFDRAPARGLVISEDQVLVADRIGRAIRRFRLEDGATLPAIRPPDQNILWPFGLSVAPGPDARVQVLDLPWRQIQHWRIPPSETALVPELPESVWPLGQREYPIELASTGEHVAVLGETGLIEMISMGGSVLQSWHPDAAGEVVVPVDIEFGADGRFYVLDGYTTTAGNALGAGRRPRLLIYDLDEGPGEPPTAATPTGTSPSPTPAPGACQVSGEVALDRARVRAGESVKVTESLRADCPDDSVAPVDVMIAFAGPHGENLETEMPTLVAAARVFADSLDWRRARVGVISKSRASQLCTLLQPLLDDPDLTERTLTSISDATACGYFGWLRLASDELSLGSRSNAQRVLVLFTAASRAEEEVRGFIHLEWLARMVADGTEAHVLELSGEPDSIARRYASRPENYRFAPDQETLVALADELGRRVRSCALRDLLLENRVHENVDYLRGSARPPAGALGRLLQYGLAIAPSEGLTLTYQVVPRVGGRYPANEQTVAHYLDGDGVRRSLFLDQPLLDVDGPTPTSVPSPTATATARPSATPGGRVAYLPVLIVEECRPERRPVDLLFVMDASTSMDTVTRSGSTRLQAATEAMTGLLDAMSSRPRRRASLVTFHEQARLEADLTSDLDEVSRALEGVATHPGSCLACGLIEAERIASRHPDDTGVSRVLIVLTDAQLDAAATDAASSVAGRLASQGLSLYAIGLGEAADGEALERIASRPEAVFLSPDAEDLVEIYLQIDRTIPCPSILHGTP